MTIDAGGIKHLRGRPIRCRLGRSGEIPAQVPLVICNKGAAFALALGEGFVSFVQHGQALVLHGLSANKELANGMQEKRKER